MRKTTHNSQTLSENRLPKATNYVDKMITNRKAFSQPKTTCAGTRAAIGNYTEVVLSATDEVFVTALILTSMYSFAAQNSSTEGVQGLVLCVFIAANIGGSFEDDDLHPYQPCVFRCIKFVQI